MQITKQTFIERVRRHMANGFPTDEFSIFNSEILLYLDAAIASTLVASMMGMAKVTREMSTPEAYIVTTQLSPLIRNDITNEWYATLPQTPLSLSIGYSITNAYFGDPSLGQSQMIWFIKNKRAAFRDYMPKPTGSSAHVRGNFIYVKANDGSSLAGLGLFVDMVQTRTNNLDDLINLPDDVFELIFDKVIAKCKDRMGIPVDEIKDNISAGASNVSKV